MRIGISELRKRCGSDSKSFVQQEMAVLFVAKLATPFGDSRLSRDSSRFFATPKPQIDTELGWFFGKRKGHRAVGVAGRCEDRVRDRRSDRNQRRLATAS